MAINIRSRKVSDYHPDKIWSSFREDKDIRPDQFATLDSFLTSVETQFKKTKEMQNLGAEGRRQVLDQAKLDFQQLPTEMRETNLYTMRARGLISRDEFDIWASQMGISRGAAEYRYRKYVKSENMIWELDYKSLLTRGEYTKLLQSKNLTYGQGYYRKRKYQAQRYGVPFRGWEKRKIGRDSKK